MWEPAPMGCIRAFTIDAEIEGLEPMGDHYIPQKYLRGFTGPSCPNALWQFDKKLHRYSEGPVAISKIAQQRSFYDPQTEKLLNNRVEVPGNRVLDKLRSGNLSLKDEDRRHLSVYIATMLKRVPFHRAKATALAPGVLKNIASELRQQIGEYSAAGQLSGETAEKRLAEVAAAEAKYAADLPDEVRDQINSPWPTGEMTDLVYRMSWRFIIADSYQYFIVTDNPAFFFENYGLGMKNSELTFPISSSLALFGSWAPVMKSNRIRNETQFVKEANRRLIGAAFRFVYSREKTNWIGKVASKAHPHLSRILW